MHNQTAQTKMDSKSLPPRTEPFFPTIFYKTQFCERQAGLPDGLELSSKVAIVTGANVGLGFESAKQLLALKLSHLILAVRSVEKGEAAAARLRQEYPKAKVEVWKLDMCSYTSVQAFAARVDRDLTRLDIALLNAGLIKPTFEVVKETGHEESMQVVSAYDTHVERSMLIIFRIIFLLFCWQSSCSDLFARREHLAASQVNLRSSTRAFL